jgi:hypothetical protein
VSGHKDREDFEERRYQESAQAIRDAMREDGITAARAALCAVVYVEPPRGVESLRAWAAEGLRQLDERMAAPRPAPPAEGLTVGREGDKA